MEKDEQIIKELESIKKLLILQLYHEGVSSDNIAKACGMSTKTIYKFLPKNQKKS